MAGLTHAEIFIFQIASVKSRLREECLIGLVHFPEELLVRGMEPSTVVTYSDMHARASLTL